MEIIGKSIPSLQSAISSGFENVNTGITETARIDGVSGLDSVFEIFSDSKMAIAGDLNLVPAVADAAEYPDPIISLGQQSSGSISSQQILQTLQDPKFRPETELATVSESMQKFMTYPDGTPTPGEYLNGYFWDKEAMDNVMKIGPEQKSMNAPQYIDSGADPKNFIGNPILGFHDQFAWNLTKTSAELKADALEPRSPVSEFVPGSPSVEGTADRSPLSMPKELGKSVEEALKGFRPKPGFSFVNEIFQGAGDSALPGESFADYNTTVERPQRLDPGSGWIQGPLNPVNKARGPVSDAQTTMQRSTFEGKRSAPNSDLTQSFQNTAAERGIIIVGGKTEGPYLQTIDDTVSQFQNDPQPQTFELLQAQFAAVQDMATTAQQTSDLLQQFNSNSMSNNTGIIPPKKYRG